jgi:hypothetical protein
VGTATRPPRATAARQPIIGNADYSRPGPVSRISCRPATFPCLASHLPPTEKRGGGAAATASSTAACPLASAIQR